ncbi:MAG: hypothetical protein U0133_08180 [Gemmatimonadales bacterium]
MDWIGWIATATFAVSYFYSDPMVLRRWQAAAALLWMTYGITIHSAPVIVANIIVATIALGSVIFRRTRSEPAAPAPTAPTAGRPTTEA